ncbi:hypothetical protein C8R45DRAFT_938135 [Mycena sanguinolenta]|nr:hypothetical protein C8R45DRAFT_938135 [Mycena sanguinolenta]
MYNAFHIAHNKHQLLEKQYWGVSELEFEPNFCLNSDPNFASTRGKLGHNCYGGPSYGLEKNHSVCVEYDSAGPEAIGEENSMITARRAACASYDYTVDTLILSQIWSTVEVNIVEDEDSVPELVETMD